MRERTRRRAADEGEAKNECERNQTQRHCGSVTELQNGVYAASGGIVVSQHIGVDDIANDVGQPFAGGFIHADEFDADLAGEDAGLDDAGDAAGDEELHIIVGDEKCVHRADGRCAPTGAETHTGG